MPLLHNNGEQSAVYVTQTLRIRALRRQIRLP